MADIKKHISKISILSLCALAPLLCLCTEIPDKEEWLRERNPTAPPTVTNHTLTVNSTPTAGGTTSPSGSSSRAAGSSVTVTATAKANYTFTGWSATTGTMPSGVNTSSASITFKMPSYNLTIVANFTSSGSTGGNTFNDSRDGKTYKTVKIGEQTWMAENLNYQISSGSWCYGEGGEVYHYNDGSWSWKTLSASEIQSNCNTYGRLYTWSEAMSACPVGWHLPNSAEWNTLMTTIGASTAGTKLKTSSWGGTDEYGFSALPGGIRSPDGNFLYFGFNGFWWTATEYDASMAPSQVMHTEEVSAIENNLYKNHGFSVRCVEGNGTNNPTTPITPTTYTLTVNSTPTAGGKTTPSGSSDRAVGSSVTVTATANAYYTFLGWSATTGTMPSGVNTSSASIMFNMPSNNLTLVANFYEKSTTPDTYKTVTIGDQTWMAENLNEVTAASWCYNDDNSNCAKYGRLYTWDAAMTACPVGWHLPSRDEWNTLVIAAGGDNAGTKLRAKSPYWDGEGTDDYGFSALPGGCHYPGQHPYDLVGSWGYWWTATRVPDAFSVYYRQLSLGNAFVGEDSGNTSLGLSVRCIED